MSDWTPPKGFELTKHEGHYLNVKGFGSSTPPADPMPDGKIEVAHFVEDEPFIWKTNDGSGPNASVEAKEAYLAGKPLEGWSPNCVSLQIKDGWVPPVYTLVHDDDASHGAVEPHEGSVA